MHVISALVTLATCTATVVASSRSPLVQRGLEYCAIVNAPSGVHCRRTPSLSAEIVYTMQNGATDAYTCYERGDCYEGNCTWDYASDFHCYVNGYFTDGKCTMASLGSCSACYPNC